MQIVSSKYKEYLNNSLSISPKSKIVVDDIEYLGDVIKTSPKFSHSNSTFIGGFPAKTVSFDIYNFNNNLDFENKEIKIYKGIVINGITEWVMQGIFIAQSKDITNNISAKIMSISKAQDKTQLFDLKYESKLNWENNQTHTGLEIVQEVCTKLDVILETTNFSWANYSFKQPNFVEDITYREVISRIAQIGGEIAFVNNNGALVIKNQTATGNKIQRKLYKNLSKEKLHTVNTVVLGKEGMNDDIKYPETITTARIEFKINDNPFVDLYREEMISTVANYIIGKSYTPFALEDFVDGFIYELNDVVTIIDKNGEEFDAVILDYSNSSRIKSNIKAETPDKNNTDYKLAGSSKEEIRKIKLDVDHVNQRIDAIASDVNENTEKVSSLEITTSNISTKVSTVETDLSTTNTNLSNLSNTVDTLSNDIDGVSADFEDFKDNEYIQSIDNLQKQIDGAIQFWNGAEIPSLNNYPANEWATENDKINHQADIYTVVQDVEGELKQGKAYRFDNVDGVWQWIELTDNELSAVQAIAQEALDNSNANATEIGTIQTNVSELQQTDEQIKASVESIDKQIIPTATATGSNIYIEDASDNPLIKLEIEGKSEQETRSGKNLFNYKDTISVTTGITTDENGWITISYDNTSGDSTIWKNYYTNNLDLKTSTKYAIVLEIKNVEGNADIHISSTTSTTGQFDGSNYILFKNLQNGDVIVTTPTTKDNFDNITYGLRTFCTFYSGTSGSITFRISVLEDTTITADNFEYEAYGVSPSPDYPSEIVSVGYENLFNENTITENYYYKDNGKLTSATTYNTSDYILCKSNEFIVSAKFTMSNPYIKYIVAEFDENKTYIQIQSSTGSSSPEYAFTLSNNTKYIRLCYRKDATLYDIQLEEGTIAHPYIPYGKTGVEVVNTGKNLFTLGQSTFSQIGVDITFNDSEYTINGTTSSEGNIFAGNLISLGTFKAGIYFFSSNLISGDYTIPSGAFATYLRKADKTLLVELKFVQKSSFTLTEDTELVYQMYTNTSGIIFNNCIARVQIEEGSVATEFEPYFRNSALFVINDQLRSLPNGVKDELIYENNVLQVNRRVGQVILDGSEEWVRNTVPVDDMTYSQYFLSIGLVGSQIGLSNCFIYDADKVVEGNIFYINSSKTLIVFPHPNTNSGDIDTLDNWKTWLSENNVEVIYELATPYIEEIGELEMPNTFKGVNHITTTDELEPTINIEYVRDTTLSSYVEGQINKVMTIEERHYSELVIEDDNIKASVTEINSNLSDMTEDIHTVQETLTSTEKTIEIISTNIDKTTGDIRELTTINGYKFNKDGLNIYTNENSFNTLINNEGTYYKDGDTVIAETTKDGFMATSIKNKGSQEYCYDETNKVYDFVKERIEVDGEYGYATFYNGVN